MGNSASTNKANEEAKERAYIRSLGDRYPLGDAELRKYVWCHCRLATNSPPPGLPSEGSLLSSLAAWSIIYGDYNPYLKSQTGKVSDPLPSAQKLIEAMSIVEQHILPHGLGACLVQGLGLNDSQHHQTSDNPSVNFPTQSMSTEEIHAWQYNYYTISSSASHERDNYALEDFLEGISVSCGRRGSRASLTKLFMLSCTDRSSKMACAAEVISVAYCLTLAASYLKNVANATSNVDWKYFVPQKSENDTKALVDSLIKSAKKQRQGYSSVSTRNNGDDGNVSMDEFIEWAQTTVPMIGSSLPTFFHVLLNFFAPISSDDHGKERRFPPGVTPIWIPSLTVETKTSTSSPASSTFVDPATSLFDLFALSCTNISLAAGRWHQLFSSEANGLSCNRLMHSILGYGGPTLILIRGKGDAGSFGAYTCTPWSQESASFYGNSDCFLFRLCPEPFAVYRPKGGGGNSSGGIEPFGTTTSSEKDETRNFQYFNPEARSKGYDGLAHGVGFGGSPELPRLYIDETLDGSCARADDLTFDNGPLLSGNSATNGSFEVEALEAYGVGSSQLIEEALFARDGQREDVAKRIRQAMKGAKGQFLEDFQSGLVGSKLFQHRNEMRGRDGGCELDKAEGHGEEIGK